MPVSRLDPSGKVCVQIWWPQYDLSHEVAFVLLRPRCGNRRDPQMWYWDGGWNVCNHIQNPACCFPAKPVFKRKKPAKKTCVQRMLSCAVACLRCSKATPGKGCCGQCVDMCRAATLACCRRHGLFGANCTIAVKRLGDAFSALCLGGARPPGGGRPKPPGQKIGHVIDDWELVDPREKEPPKESAK